VLMVGVGLNNSASFAPSTARTESIASDLITSARTSSTGYNISNVVAAFARAVTAWHACAVYLVGLKHGATLLSQEKPQGGMCLLIARTGTYALFTITWKGQL
jgi:hypothetical protein